MRSLAKQAEIKDDEPTDQRAPSAGTSGSNSAANNMHMQQQRPSNSAENRNVESAVAMDNRQKRKANSPPPEKVFFLVLFIFFGFSDLLRNECSKLYVSCDASHNFNLWKTL